MAKKHKTSIQLTPDAKALLVRLANTHGVSQSAIVELAIREKAERSGILSWPTPS